MTQKKVFIIFNKNDQIWSRIRIHFLYPDCITDKNNLRPIWHYKVNLHYKNRQEKKDLLRPKQLKPNSGKQIATFQHGRFRY
jgi:hypothetical protein